MGKKKTKPLLVFYILHVYVLAQFGWWTYHIYDLNKTIHQQENRIIESTFENQQQKETAIQNLDKDLNQRFWMIVGEGGVFFILLILGGYYTRKAFKKEEAVVKQQNNFLMSVTHELKSPLASTKLTLETFEKKTENTQEKQMLSQAIAETNRLNALVDNMLTATQMQNANYYLNKQKQNLSRCIQQLLERQQFNTQQKINANIQSDIISEFDQHAIESIVLNLVENAIKYSSTQKEILVILSRENENITLSVSDDGIGIAENEKQKIFDKFYRIGSEETRTAKGTGLGLYIVKYLVELHNGKIAVKENQPQGSTFEITFQA